MSDSEQPKKDDFDIRTYSKLGSIINIINTIEFENKDEVLRLLDKAKNKIYEEGT